MAVSEKRRTFVSGRPPVQSRHGKDFQCCHRPEVDKENGQMKQHTSHIVIALVAVAFFMEYIDSTALVTALPQMAADFGVESGRMSIGITAYMISLAVFIPVSGWVADRYGTRSVFAYAVLGFIGTSVLCSLCRGLMQFAVVRFLQGVAGAMMVPVGRLAVLKNCDKGDLVNAIAWITTPGLVAPVIGPPIGGFLATYLSWHWIFFLNIPIGLLVFLLAIRYVPRQPADRQRGRLDVPDFLLSALSLSGVMYSLELLGGDAADLLLPLSLLSVCVCLFAFSIRRSLRSPSPLIDYSVMRVPTYSVTIVYGTLSMMVIGAAPFLLPLLFQDGLHFNAFHSGLLLLSLMLGNLVTKPFTVWMMHHWRIKHILFLNALLLSLSTAACAFFDVSSPIIAIIICLFLMGSFRSVQLSTLHTVAYVDVPQQKMSSANTLYSTALQLASGLGVGLGALALRVSSAVSSVSGSLVRYQLSFVLIAAVGLAALVGYGRMKEDAGRIIGRF